MEILAIIFILFLVVFIGVECYIGKTRKWGCNRKGIKMIEYTLPLAFIVVAAIALYRM